MGAPNVTSWQEVALAALNVVQVVALAHLSVQVRVLKERRSEDRGRHARRASDDG